jgi:hypothetical protein
LGPGQADVWGFAQMAAPSLKERLHGRASTQGTRVLNFAYIHISIGIPAAFTERKKGKKKKAVREICQNEIYNDVV